VIHEADSHGSKFDNGSWKGKMALVSSGVADIGIGNFGVTKERFEVVAFTDTIQFER
jgi:ABC-type amino acid transport substrate-binding protein